MMARSHVLVTCSGWGVGMLAVHTRLAAQRPIEFGVSLGLVTIMATGPDVDIRMGSLMMDLLGGHRGWTHTILATVLVTAATWAVAAGLAVPKPQLYAAAACWGWFSHLLCDACTKGGVPFLKPLTNKRYSLGLYRTGSLLEYATVGLWLLACIVAAGALIDRTALAEDVAKLERTAR